MKRLFILAPLIILAACVTHLAPGAEKVRLVRDASAVTGCKVVGSVTSSYEFGEATMGKDYNKFIKNQAFGLGADTVLLTNSMLTMPSGVAYRCASGSLAAN
jgi:hypothetical protein